MLQGWQGWWTNGKWWPGLNVFRWGDSTIGKELTGM